jgi:adenosylcobyric acid synthase
MSLPAPCLMVQGTGSGVGKTVLTAALCRLFARAGYRVAPFKSQNMALNSAVTADGGEIGRAQAAQAEAAGVAPTVDMNPILLKPETDARAQLVVRGVAGTSVTFREYMGMKAAMLAVVEESLARLRATHDLVVIEGAGSPAEINLADTEIVNMRVARLAHARVLLVGDIDRGGVFAALLGTLALLDPDDQPRVAGFIVNKFRGDPSLLTPGLDLLTARTGVPVLGVVPYLAERLVPAEDSLDLADERERTASDPTVIEVAVVRLPHLANFDDVEPLAGEPDVRVRFVTSPAALADADVIVLPGSKTTVADLAWLRERGLARALVDAARAGCPVLGLCGGYQMLGTAIHDPDGVESAQAESAGLALLPAVTTFTRPKRTVRVRARVSAGHGLFAAAAGADFDAYEIHAGRTDVSTSGRPFTLVSGTVREDTTDAAGRLVGEGAMDGTGRVVGTYLHGLLADGRLRRALLTAVAQSSGKPVHAAWGERSAMAARYDRLADIVGAAVDMAAVAKLIGLAYPRA